MRGECDDLSDHTLRRGDRHGSRGAAGERHGLDPGGGRSGGRVADRPARAGAATEVDGLPAKPVRERERAAAVSGGDVRVMPVHGAGYGGFRVARRPGGEDPGVVVRHPAGPGVVRRGGKGRTDRTGARGTVRALRARDGGDRDAMSPVRVPTVAEEEGRRLLRRRERPVKERLRLAGAVAGLLRPRGVPPGDPARRGCRARPGGMRTACGTGLPPGLLAEIGGILDRLEPGVAGLKAVEAFLRARPP